MAIPFTIITEYVCSEELVPLKPLTLQERTQKGLNPKANAIRPPPITVCGYGMDIAMP